MSVAKRCPWVSAIFFVFKLCAFLIVCFVSFITPLQDTPAVQTMVAKWTQFWVQYRSILTQDIVHVKRPDMQSIDSLMHVSANTSMDVAALAMVYNPTLVNQSMLWMSQFRSFIVRLSTGQNRGAYFPKSHYLILSYEIRVA